MIFSWKLIQTIFFISKSRGKNQTYFSNIFKLQKTITSLKIENIKIQNNKNGKWEIWKSKILKKLKIKIWKIANPKIEHLENWKFDILLQLKNYVLLIFARFEQIWIYFNIYWSSRIICTCLNINASIIKEVKAV